MFDLLGAIGNEDIAFSWIRELFGDDPSRPLSSAFAVFTTSLVFLGSLLMGWHILIGIIHSAYTGKVLGERWHQIWAPMRVVVGFGMLVPVGGGFSAVHSLLENVVGVAAVNLGNAPIVAYIKSATARENAMKVRTTYGATLAMEFLKKEMCFHIVDKMNSGTVGRYLPGATVAYQPTKGSADGLIDLTTTATVWFYGDCGSVNFNLITNPGSEMFVGTDMQLDNFNKVRQEATTKLMLDIRKSSVVNFGKVAETIVLNGGWDPNVVSVDQLVNQLISKNYMSPQVLTELTGLAANWNEKVSEAAGLVFKDASENNAKALLARIERFGFMVAGSYERSLSSIAGMTVKLASSTAIIEPFDLSEKYETNVKKSYQLISGLQAKDFLVAASSGLAEPTNEDDWIPWLLSKVFGDNLSNAWIGKPSDDPVGDMMALGHSLLNTASLAIIGMTAAALVAGGSSNAVQQTGSVTFEYLASQLGWIIMTFILVGFLYAFVLPMMPMIMVFIMGVSWLILFLEAAIAGVLWAFAFIRMDGQEFFDRNQAPGVTLLFNLLLRPALGMLAYCGLLLLQPVLLNSLALIWSEGFTIQTGGSLGGLVVIWQFVALLVIYSYLQWQLTLRLTGLIPSIPDRVGHWMGMQMHGYNDGQETSNMLAVIAPVARSGFAQAPLGTMGGDMAKARASVDEKARRAAEHAARTGNQQPNQAQPRPAGGDGGSNGSQPPAQKPEK